MARRGGPRLALQSGLVAVLAALIALALIAETSALTCDTDVQFKSSGGGLLGGLSSLSLSSVKGDSLCDNVNRDKFAKGAQVSATIAWGAKSRIISIGNPTCSAIAFHSARDYAGGPYVTYLRPPSIPDDTKWTLNANDLPASVRCERGCWLDCGLTAKCVKRNGNQMCVCPASQLYSDKQKQCFECSGGCGEVAQCTLMDDGTSQCVCPEGLSFTSATKTCQGKPSTAMCSGGCGEVAQCTLMDDGTSQCVCPEGLSFNSAKKTCQDVDPCATTTCAANAVCRVKKNRKAKCECSRGYIKKNGICTALCKPTCPRYAECAVVATKPTCRCRSGYTMKRKNKQNIKCIRLSQRRN